MTLSQISERSNGINNQNVSSSDQRHSGTNEASSAQSTPGTTTTTSASPTKSNGIQQDSSQRPRTPSSTTQPHNIASQQQGFTGGPGIAKDRRCPFCNQLFTSSSLGRHLDLYIRERNPKPPDGVHDVESIRRIRAGITRRQARNSGANGARSGGDSKGARGSSPSPSSSPGVDASENIETNRRAPPSESVRFSHGFHILNKADWTATGVINNLPPRSTAVPVLLESKVITKPLGTRTETATARVGTSLTGPSGGHKAADRDERHETQTNRHASMAVQQQEITLASARASAAERALKAVLDTLSAAVIRTHQVKLFDFDLFTLNFPALCLRILPLASALHSSAPGTNSDDRTHASTGPPGQMQYDSLKNKVYERIEAYRQNLRGQLPGLGSSNESEVGLGESEQQKYFDHLSDSFVHWSSLPASQKQHIWEEELLRGYSQERERREKAEWSIEELQDELAELKLEKQHNSTRPTAPYMPWSATSYNGSTSSQYAPIQRNPSRSNNVSSSTAITAAVPTGRDAADSLSLSNGRRVSSSSSSMPRRNIPLDTIQEMKRLRSDIQKWDYNSLLRKFGGTTTTASDSVTTAHPGVNDGGIIRTSEPSIPQFDGGGGRGAGADERTPKRARIEHTSVFPQNAYQNSRNSDYVHTAERTYEGQERKRKTREEHGSYKSSDMYDINDRDKGEDDDDGESEGIDDEDDEETDEDDAYQERMDEDTPQSGRSNMRREDIAEKRTSGHDGTSDPDRRYRELDTAILRNVMQRNGGY